MAATFRISLNSDRFGEVSATTTLDQTGADDLLAWVMDAYGTDDEGNPREPVAAIRAAMAGTMRGVADNVSRHKRDVAARQAAEAVVPLVVTVE